MNWPEAILGSVIVICFTWFFTNIVQKAVKT